MSHGGPRKGAGRPARAAKASATVSLRLSAEERALCKRLAKRLDCSESDVLRMGLRALDASGVNGVGAVKIRKGEKP